MLVVYDVKLWFRPFDSTWYYVNNKDIPDLLIRRKRDSNCDNDGNEINKNDVK